VNFPSDLLTATSSNVAILFSVEWNVKQQIYFQCGWLNRENAYKTRGHFVCTLLHVGIAFPVLCWNLWYCNYSGL